ncbi:MAG: ABC transporter ATP-binding protein [Actinomycetota bacterium]
MRRWPTFLRLMRHCRPYRRKLILAFFAAAGVAVAVPTIPLFVRDAIDGAIPRSDFRQLGILVGAMLGVALIKAFFHGVRRQIAGELSIGVEADLREQLYNHVQALDVGYHERISTGQIMSRATSDIQAIRQYLMSVAWSLTLFIQIIVIFGVMFYLSPPIAGIFLATSPVMAWYTYRFADKFDPIVWEMQQRLGDLASVVEETVVGIRVVKGFGQEAQQVAKLSGDAERVYDAAMESVKLRAKFVPVFNLVPQMGLIAVLWYGGRLAISGSLSSGTIIALFSYLFMLIWPLRSVGMIVAWAQRATTSAGRVFEILDTPPGIADHADAKPLDVAAATIAFSDVHFAYPDGGAVLAGVDLEVPAGTSVALVGHTGCGKSTLMRIVPRFIEPSDGDVTIDGQSISAVTLASLRAQIGIVFEDTLLFSDTIAANIAFGRPDSSEEEIVRAAVIAQAHEFIEELPQGYDTPVGEHGYTLSGGQRQRVAIARAILMNPKILILDDATSNVDARVEAAIRKGLRSAMTGRTTIIVARRPQTAALADRVAFMEAGRIVDVGTHTDLWRDNKAYRETLLATVDVDSIAEEAGLEVEHIEEGVEETVH